MEDYYNPKNPESELAKLKVRVKALERRFGEKWEGLERSPPSGGSPQHHATDILRGA